MRYCKTNSCDSYQEISCDTVPVFLGALREQESRILVRIPKWAYSSTGSPPADQSSDVAIAPRQVLSPPPRVPCTFARHEDPRVIVKVPSWSYATNGYTPAHQGVGVVNITNPVVSSETGEISWYHKHLSVAQKYICKSVRPGTKVTYGTGERRWFVVADLIGTDVLMRVVPSAWNHRPFELRMSSMTWQESCMLAFLTSCRDAGQMVVPKTAFAYLSAVKKFFQVNGVDVNFFENSHYIQNTKAGMMNSYRMTANRDIIKDKRRMPISIGMIQDYDSHLRSSLPHYGVVQMASHAAQLLAYTTLSRVSEYLLVDGEAEHLLVSECILFEMGSGCLVPSCELLGLDLAQVTGCVIDILSAKNDPEHKGHRMYFGMADLSDPHQTYCITTVLWNYAKTALPTRGRSFFYVCNINWTLQ